MGPSTLSVRAASARGEVPWEYGRAPAPSVDAVAGRVAALEGAESALLFGSGMAAIRSSLLALTPRDGRLVAARQLYGDAYLFLARSLPELGIETAFVDVGDRAGWERALARGADVVYLETISNPLLRVADLPAVAALAHEAGALVVADSTLASPRNLRPLAHGVDLVVHSATKYLNGHADLRAGAVAGPSSLVETIRERSWSPETRLSQGGAFLLERGLKTLSLRMERHNANGLEVARRLQGHPELEHVSYPLLAPHADHTLAERLLDGASGIVTIRIRGGESRAAQVLGALRLVREVPSLGGVESFASLPARSSHARLTQAARERLGIRPGTIRLSLGIEDADDLVSDLERALG